MKFYGNDVVWDKEKGKVLCRFHEGECHTESLYIIEKLKNAGFISDTPIENEPVYDEDKPIDKDALIAELRLKAEELGIKVNMSWGVPKLTSVIAEIEGAIE